MCSENSPATMEAASSTQADKTQKCRNIVALWVRAIMKRYELETVPLYYHKIGVIKFRFSVGSSVKDDIVSLLRWIRH